MNTIIYLALGTNIGDRSANLQAARAALPPAVQIALQSPIYETQPWGYLEQGPFLNQVLEANTTLAPDELLAHLKQIEMHLGRQPSVRYGPRLIDLDILLFGAQVINTPTLTIPHAHLFERAFTLIPLADIAPDLIAPNQTQSIGKLASQIDHQGIRRYFPA
jgi:2-amino-4-hydroxy-6-hydroxymethyldihydropteridine diphosphokinase